MQFKTLFVSVIALAAGAQAASLTGTAKAGKYEVSIAAIEGSNSSALISYKVDTSLELDTRGSIWTCKNIRGCAAALAPNVAACTAAVDQKFNPFAYASCFAQALNNKVNPPSACANCYN